MKRLNICILIMCCLMLTACTLPDLTPNKESVSYVQAMDTYMTLTAYGKYGAEANAAAEAEIKRMDAMLSTGEPDSEVSLLNASGSLTEASPETLELVSRGKELWQDTGCFDIAIYPVMQLWGFDTGDHRVPDEAELAETLPLADPDYVDVDEQTSGISFNKSGVEIDLGGIAKGYTAQRVMSIMADMGVKSAIISLGGNVQTLGYKPDGSCWNVAVYDPNEESEVLCAVSVHDMAVVTSGGYERCFEQDGVTYHHIIDPVTGYPADSGITQVTIVSTDGTLADALSTSIYIMGVDQATDYWQSHRDQFDMILLTDDGKLLVTEGLETSFRSDREYSIIR